MVGAKAILKGTIVSCDVRTSSLQKFDRQGFESYKVEKVNEEGKKVGNPLPQGDLPGIHPCRGLDHSTNRFH